MMMEWLFLLAFFAEDGPQQPNPFLSLLPMFAALIFLWYFIIHLPQKRDRQRRDDQLKALKKNDRVVTIGGIIGTIAGMSQDGRDVTLKVDDNTRIRVLRSSVQGPYKEKEDANASK